MVKKRVRRPYWRRTKLLLLMSLLAPIALILAAPMFLDSLEGRRFIGFPVTYFAIAHGTALIAVFAVLRFISRQENVDRWHGAHEDF